MQFPQYKQQYLNLSLSIMRLCGLAISNARNDQRLQEAERAARKEKEISETPRMVETSSCFYCRRRIFWRLKKIAEHLRMMVSSFSIECEPEELHVTLSLGVACLESGCKSFAELLRRSDEALPEAKRAGRKSIKSWKSR